MEVVLSAGAGVCVCEDEEEGLGGRATIVPLAEILAPVVSLVFEKEDTL